MQTQRGDVAFVLGGGGVLGASEVGMLRALLERDIVPDLVVGTSVGAINGALVAADPSVRSVQQLEQMWTEIAAGDIFGGSIVARVGRLVRTRTNLHSPAPLRRLLEAQLPQQRIEDLAVRFQCVAASIEKAAERWFDSGPLVDAVLASCAVPGLLPAVEIDGEHYLDGGLVHSIPVGRAIALGARTVYVLHVGRIERPLAPPRYPWEVALVAFEIARRHRFAADMSSVPHDVQVVVLPAGEDGKLTDLSQFRYRDFSKVRTRIDRAYDAASAHLDAVRA